MLRGHIATIALVALLGMSSAVACNDVASGPQTTDSSASPPPQLNASPGVAVAQSTSCASECQTQHDRCRVQTKGSPSCDAERQRCLEICLQKKKRP